MNIFYIPLHFTPQKTSLFIIIKLSMTRNTKAYKIWKTLESPLDSKEIKPVHPKGNQPLLFTGRTDAEAEASILWPPEAKNQLIGKDLDAGKNWEQEKKETTEDEMVEQHHWLKDEFEQPLGDYEAFGVSENRTRLSNSNSNNNHDKEYKSISLCIQHHLSVNFVIIISTALLEDWLWDNSFLSNIVATFPGSCLHGHHTMSSAPTLCTEFCSCYDWTWGGDPAPVGPVIFSLLGIWFVIETQEVSFSSLHWGKCKCRRLREKIYLLSWLTVWKNRSLGNRRAMCLCANSLQSCPTLCDPMDCSPPGSSVHDVIQSRILEWVAMSFSRGSSQQRDWSLILYVFFIGRRVFYH